MDSVDLDARFSGFESLGLMKHIADIMPYIHMSYKAEYDLKRLTSENYRYQGNAAKGGQLL